MHRPTAEEAQQSLRDHVVAKALEARAKFVRCVDGHELPVIGAAPASCGCSDQRAVIDAAPAICACSGQRAVASTPPLDRAALDALLLDRSVVRYPLGVRFDSEPLQPGEFACLEALGDHPSAGFCLFVHPMFEAEHDLIPALAVYYIPSVNYGEVATHVEAELFGATLLGLEVEAYYRLLCSVADAVPRAPDSAPSSAPPPPTLGVDPS